MIREWFEWARNLTCGYVTPEFVHRKGDPDHIVHLRTGDGEMILQELVPGDRTVQLGRIDDLINLARNHFDERVVEAGRQAVFFDRSAVTLVWDTRHGRECAVVRLETSSEHQFFGQLRIEATVAELRDTLRRTLHACFRDAGLLAQVSSLSVDNRTYAYTESARSKESIGQTVLKQVSEPANLPQDDQTFLVRMWSNAELGQRCPVRFLLDPNAQKCTWRITVLEPEWDAYLEAHLRVVETMLVKGLEGKGVPIYQGRFMRADIEARAAFARD